MPSMFNIRRSYLLPKFIISREIFALRSGRGVLGEFVIIFIYLSRQSSLGLVVFARGLGMGEFRMKQNLEVVEEMRLSTRKKVEEKPPQAVTDGGIRGQGHTHCPGGVHRRAAPLLRHVLSMPRQPRSPTPKTFINFTTYQSYFVRGIDQRATILIDEQGIPKPNVS